MEFPDAIIKIIEDSQCPLYSLGDEFCLSGNALIVPPDKPVCLILVKDISELFGKRDSDTPRQTFFCGGCSGKIRLGYKKDPSAGMPPQKKSEEELNAIADMLSGFSLFQDLSRENIKEIISFLKLKKYGEGETVIRKGEPGRNLYIIVSGRVEILEDADVSIAFLGSGEIFGEMSLLSGDPVGATVKVTEAAKLLYISSRDFRQVLNRFPTLQMYFAKMLARRLTNINVARAQEFSSGMVGKLSEMPPSELFQTLNSHQKTGILLLDLSRGTASISFRDGELVRAHYMENEGIKAFFAVMGEKSGRFKFMPGLPEEDMKSEPLGDFMWLLMEGVRKVDEE
ncbi:MAG: cyclic nucleotide-binding domain-containing protein [Desulfococcaceae bacterium]